jgi:hypothetical protein
MIGMQGLLLTPGIYYLDTPIFVKAQGFVVLGIGYATLVSTLGLPAILVDDDLEDVRIAGVLLEAGTGASSEFASPTLPLLLWGRKCRSAACFMERATGSFRVPEKSLNSTKGASGVVSDVFARVGAFNYSGCQVMRADTMVQIRSDDVVLDNMWIWHADHDDCGTDPMEGKHSDKCQSTHGLVVDGHRTTAYGLAVEHIHAGDHVVWNGEYGETYFFQCELPYHEKGFKAHGYTVARSVQNHTAFGIGVYIIFDTAKVKSGVLLPPSAKADHVFNIVIAGRGDQFQYVACTHGEDAQNETNETCYGPSCPSWGRCFVDAMPREKPLDMKLPKAKKTNESRAPARSDSHLGSVDPGESDPHFLFHTFLQSTKESRDGKAHLGSVDPGESDPHVLFHTFLQSTKESRDGKASCGDIATWASHPGCALQPGIGCALLAATVILITLANKICTKRKADNGNRLALIPSQAETRDPCFTDLPTTPFDDTELAHGTAASI